MDKAHQKKLSATALAEQLGMEFPQQGLPVESDGNCTADDGWISPSNFLSIPALSL
jgi:hypothetical protein